MNNRHCAATLYIVPCTNTRVTPQKKIEFRSLIMQLSFEGHYMLHARGRLSF
jgi:hypothetical protein